MRRSPDQATYESGVERIREYIRAGDAFQVVLSQRAERPTSASAVELYRALRRVNPSPYLFLLELGEDGERALRVVLLAGRHLGHRQRRPGDLHLLAGPVGDVEDGRLVRHVAQHTGRAADAPR